MNIKLTKEKKNLYFAQLIDDNAMCSEGFTPEEAIINLWYAYDLAIEHRIQQQKDISTSRWNLVHDRKKIFTTIVDFKSLTITL